ncbi:hypothetical protein [Alkalihalobacillus trypoxylicola]|uniref:Uncharacterized protein n=1 Tax=Alkalihalobacillus trypoxylicola TaxID=519424 RepID=A0A161PFM0_9BACI|nr:hypothetical protein [Alkalihalobacillus trypoxylicola]KYG31937.1 hypothetical protein AZF04_03950 [Alkalihalobacillus trypoxylicola]
MTKDKYEATFHFEHTVVHVVSPEYVTEKESQQLLNSFHLAGWNAWNSLNTKQQERLNQDEE